MPTLFEAVNVDPVNYEGAAYPGLRSPILINKGYSVIVCSVKYALGSPTDKCNLIHLSQNHVLGMHESGTGAVAGVNSIFHHIFSNVPGSGSGAGAVTSPVEYDSTLWGTLPFGKITQIFGTTSGTFSVQRHIIDLPEEFYFNILSLGGAPYAGNLSMCVTAA